MLSLAAFAMSDPARANEAEEADGAPRPLFGEGAEVRKAEGETEELPTLPGTEGEHGTVLEGELGGLETMALGLALDQSQGFEVDMWRGTSDRAASRGLADLPSDPPTALRYALLRNLLLTAAQDPNGAQQERFLTLRAKAALKAGMIHEASALLDLQDGQSPDNDRLKVRARIHLLRSEKRAACAIAGVTRKDIEDPFWLRLRTYCYVALDEPSRASLSMALMEEQGIKDPLAFALVSNLVSGADIPVDPGLARDEVHFALLEEANVPLEIKDLTRVPVRLRRQAIQRAISENSSQSGSIRAWAALERDVERGRASLGELVRAAEVIHLTDEERQIALQGQKTDNPLKRLALFQEVHRAVMPNEKAGLLFRAYLDAERDGHLPRFYRVYGPRLASIPREEAFAPFALAFVEGALVSGRIEEATEWLRLGKTIAHRSVETYDRHEALTIIHALASQPHGATPAWDAKARLTKAQGAALERRALLEVALHLALGGSLDTDTRRIFLASNLEDGGFLPSRELLAQLESASRSGRRAETVMVVLQILGDSNSAQMSIRTLEKCVAALHRAGFSNNAKTLAIESLLAELEPTVP